MAPAQTKERLTPGARKAVVAGTVGTLIEWYDYALYGAASGLVIQHIFFPEMLPQAGALAAFATFAVGFVARPLGGIVIAHLGDRIGRKPALLLSVVLMGGATVAMGLIPSALTIGIFATLLLIFLRLVQGFGAGAELAGAVTVIAEYAPASRRGFFTSLPNATTAAGSMLATLAFLLVSALPEEALLSWGWRIPFLASAVLFILAVFIRRRLDETPEYRQAVERSEENKRANRVPVGQLLKNSPREVAFGFLSITGHNAWNYVIVTFAISYLTTTLELSRLQSLLPVVIASFFGMLLCPLFGALGDRIGFKKVFAGGAVFAALFVFPLFAALDSRSIVLATLAMSIGYGVGFGAMAGAQAAFLANLFPVRYRYSGIAFARELNGVAIAGTTPLIASALVLAAGGSPWLVCVFIIVCCVLSLVGILGVGRFGDSDAEAAESARRGE